MATDDTRPACTIDDEQRWKRYEEALRYLHEHPAAPLETNETRPPGFFEGWQTAVSIIWFQFELMSRGAGFPESEAIMGPVVSKATGYPSRPAYDDLAVVVREIATTEDIYQVMHWRSESDGGSGSYCVICDAGIRGEHAPDCLVSRARALAARLPPA